MDPIEEYTTKTTIDCNNELNSVKIVTYGSKERKIEVKIKKGEFKLIFDATETY